MNKKLKKALQNAFEPPKPIHEKEFIKQFPQPTISTLSFVLSQIRYIQKYVWIVSFAVFLIALMGARACLLYTSGRVGVVQIHPVFADLFAAFDTRPPKQREETRESL